MSLPNTLMLSVLTELLKASVKFMVEQLKPTDRLTVVAFDNRVSTVLPPTFMTVEGKRAACGAVTGVRAGGGTNLSGGLFEGLELFRRRTEVSWAIWLKLCIHAKWGCGIAVSGALYGHYHWV